MRSPLAAAAFLLFASLGASAQKIDLSGLTGGPSPTPGPSGGEASAAGPQKQIVLAAIREVAASDAANNLFGEVFGSRAKPDGTSEAYDVKKLKEAAAVLEGMIKDGRIKINPAERGAAGAWAPDIAAGAMTGGSYDVGDPKAVKAIGRRPARFSDYFTQDQYANTILHETVHMFYSVAVLVQGFTPQSQPKVETKFTSCTFWNGSRPPVPGQAESCYHWTLSAHGYGKDGNATEYLARTISLKMCETEGCSPYRRVLEPAF